MKKWVLVFLLSVGMVVAPTMESKAIVWKVVTAAVKKVLRAIDLQVQRQQNKVIWLQNAQKTLENLMSKLKLEDIGEWTQKQKEQYGKYFEELNKVKSLISYYQRVRDIGEKQVLLVNEYRRVWQVIQRDKNFTGEEIEFMANVYGGILRESIKNIDQLAMVVNSFKTQMSDGQRLEIISKVADEVDQNYTDLLTFNRENSMLSLQRTKDKAQHVVVRRMYGIGN